MLRQRLVQTVDVLPCESLSDVSQLCGLIDHEDTIVITDYGEAGPWGSSCTHYIKHLDGLVLSALVGSIIRMGRCRGTL